MQGVGRNDACRRSRRLRFTHSRPRALTGTRGRRDSEPAHDRKDNRQQDRQRPPEQAVAPNAQLHECPPDSCCGPSGRAYKHIDARTNAPWKKGTEKTRAARPAYRAPGSRSTAEPGPRPSDLPATPRFSVPTTQSRGGRGAGHGVPGRLSRPTGEGLRGRRPFTLPGRGHGGRRTAAMSSSES